MRVVLNLFVITLLSTSFCFAQPVGFDIPTINLNLNKGFDITYSYVLRDVPHMFCYDSHTGKAAFWNMAKGERPIVSLSLDKNWEHFSVIQGNNNRMLYILANSYEGKLKITNDILQIASKDTSILSNGFSNNQWSLTEIVTFGATPYLFRYSRTTGEGWLNEIDPELGQIAKETVKYRLESGWSSISFTQTAGGIYVLKRSRFKETIAVELISTDKYPNNIPNSKLFETNKQLRYEDAQAWTDAVFFANDKQRYLFLYNSVNGHINLLQLCESLSGYTKSYATTWSTGWSNFNVIEIEGKPYLFHHKEANGLARISRIILE